MSDQILTPAARWPYPQVSREALCASGLLLADVSALLLAALLANTLHWLYRENENAAFFELWHGARAEDRLLILALLATVAIATFWLLGHYNRRRPFWDELAELLRVLVLLAALDAMLLYLAKLPFSRAWFISLWCSAMVLIPSLRLLTKFLLLKLKLWQRLAIVLGCGRNAWEAAVALQSERAMGFDVVAFAIPQTADGNGERSIRIDDHRLVPLIRFDPNDPHSLTRSDHVALVVAYDQQDEFTSQINLISRLHRRRGDLYVAPPLRGLPLYGTRISYVFRHEVLFLSLRNNLARRGPRILKRAFDLVMSGFLLLAGAPVLICLASCIRRDGGSVFFGHWRIGRHGRPFRCLKFRTMVPNAEAVLEQVLATDPAARAEWDRDFKLKHDPRITPLGRLLRCYSLDELPQLWNVFKGEMSLVGPRPIVASELERYGEDSELYLETRPGITGLWQISGRNDTGYAERVHLDAWYAKNWSLWMDIVILLKTIRVVLRHDGAY
ncbi:MAG: undecaprenyl-phosphate galactose phosphotransferase WbaP [Candidatus Contendobacter sp.]|nr:undecaprenyl-phosphate galactose phosphotransferase WbaP [Candidatus Contendobacter sp.]